MFKRFKIYLFTFTLFVLSCFISSFETVTAAYEYCEEKIDNTTYYDCGDYIYTYPEDTANSSIIFSTDDDRSIIYVGEYDGVSLFYSREFKIFNRSYDDTSKDDNNLWTKVYNKGTLIYDGEFEDSWLLNDSHSGYIRTMYKDSYSIVQYINNGKKYRTIAIRRVENGEIELLNAQYNGLNLEAGINEILEAKEDVNINFNSKYGIKKVAVKMNGNYIDAFINQGNVIVSKSTINHNLVSGAVNELRIEVNDYLDFSYSLKYKLLLVNNEVSIKFSSIDSISESASRRIVVDAIAGKGKSLDTDYCWYYWSTSQDDVLSYDEFLKNYSESEYKGSYSEDKGVILRNTTGTYYLYALAKDDDSWVVAKSEGYVLNNKGYKVNYKTTDLIFVGVLLVIAVTPIVIYLYLGKKEY